MSVGSIQGSGAAAPVGSRQARDPQALVAQLEAQLSLMLQGQIQAQAAIVQAEMADIAALEETIGTLREAEAAAGPGGASWHRSPLAEALERLHELAVEPPTGILGRESLSKAELRLLGEAARERLGVMLEVHAKEVLKLELLQRQAEASQAASLAAQAGPG